MDLGQPDDVQNLQLELLELINSEQHYQAFVQYSNSTQENNEINAGVRDGSVHILRCLKVWYDLPCDILFVAVNLMDRFLSKIKAKPKHMACISVSSFYLACRLVAQSKLVQTFTIPDPKDLIIISQCKCTLGDLMRMEKIILNKLCTGSSLPTTPMHFLRLFNSLLLAVAQKLNITYIYEKLISSSKLWLHLEVLACDTACINFCAREVALVLLCLELDMGVIKMDFLEDPNTAAAVIQLRDITEMLREMCNITDNNFHRCCDVISSILHRYNAYSNTPHRQRLSWPLSQRTLRILRPTLKLTSVLPTIHEYGLLQVSSRIRSSSLSSNESCDSEKE